MIAKAFTPESGGKGFVITWISGLAVTAALRVGFQGWKRSGRRPPEAAAVEHQAQLFKGSIAAARMRRRWRM
jgi:hypothetical protein